MQLTALFSISTFISSILATSSQLPLVASTVKSTFTEPPHLGFGTWNLDPKANASDAVATAIATGYRHIDCAKAYYNQEEIGKGIAEGLKKAGISREDVWVTSKLWNDRHEPSQVEDGLDDTLKELGLDYLDLYLMHWPVGVSPSGHTYLSYVDTWHAMERLLDTGKVRHIGVCNFSPEQLAHLIAQSSLKPFAHQMELHPYLQQNEWIQWHTAHGIHVTAYSPLGNSNPTYKPKKDDPPLLLKSEGLISIAEKRGCTPAQVALAWGMSRGISVIPKSAHADRIAENFGTLECDLEYDDFVAIAELGKNNLKRFNNPSDGWGVKLFENLDDA